MKTYLSSSDAAGLLGVSCSTVTRLAKAGILKGLKVGKHWRFSDISIQNLRNELAAGTKSPHPKNLD